MYNLVELLATKTTKQVTNMIRVRIERERLAFNFNNKYDNFPFNEIKSYETKINKNNEIINDCYDWIKDASHYFSAESWDSMIAECTDCLDQWGHETLCQG